MKPCNEKIVAVGENYETTLEVTNTTDEDAEEGEEAATESTVSAVQTRRQQALEARKCEEDDQASIASGAVPSDLMKYDTLFGTSREKTRLSKSQRRFQAVTRRNAVTKPETLASLTPQQLQEAQADDESLEPIWMAAQEGRDVFFIKGQTLYHQGVNEWGEDTDQLVVPTKFRNEVMMMTHGREAGCTFRC